MLRYEYLPSDFNPKFLMLGEGEDFAALTALLRLFARDQGAVHVNAQIEPEPCGPRLEVRPATDRYGMRRLDGIYAWYLNAYQAEAIAARLEDLSDPALVNGSDLFELGAEGEIPVAVSRGEFPDAYLHTRGP